MRIAITSRGSRGDVHPVIEIAAALLREGHQVTASFPGTFEHVVAGRCGSCDLYGEDSEEVMQELGAGWAGGARALRWFSRDVAHQVDRLLAITEDADVLVSSAAELAAPTVAEHRRIPHYRVAYAPILPGDQPPPLIPLQGLPGIANKGLWRVLNGAAGLAVRAFLEGHRRRLGLPPVDDVGAHFAGRCTTLLAISSTLAPPSPEWTYRYTYTGYCFDDGRGLIDEGTRRFLEQGPPPIYLGFGSVSVSDPASFTRMVLAAARRARCRLLLGAGWTGLGQVELPPEVHVVDEVPHGILFPRVAAVAHHGGSGTTHTAAKCGVPQFVMPQIADQFYWGHRVASLGLGPRPVAPAWLSTRRLAQVFRQLAHDRGYGRRARAIAPQVAVDGVAAAAAIIGGEAARRPVRRERTLAEAPEPSTRSRTASAVPQ